MKPCIAQICSLDAPVEEVIEEYAAGGACALELWLTTIEEYLKTHSIDHLREVAQRNEVSFPVASMQGGLLVTQGEQRREAWDLFRRRLDLCVELGVTTLVVAADVAPPIDQQDVDRVTESLAEMVGEVGPRRMRVALEFQAGSAFVNNLQTAVAVVGEVGSPHLGVCLDTFHWYIGPSKTEDLLLLTPQNLFHVQVSDLAGTPREFAADSQRILPGEGDLPLADIVSRLQQLGYTGHVSLEVLNPMLWRIPATQFGEVGCQALAHLLNSPEVVD